MELKENEQQMIDILGYKLIFKADTNLYGENAALPKILLGHTSDEIKELIIKLCRKKYFLAGKKIKETAFDEHTSVPFVINWDSIINSGLMNNNSKIAKLRSDNPITYETLYRKANYLSTVEFFGFKKQAKTINTLDSLILLYFRSLKRYNEQFNGREPLSISDVYTNLHLNIIATGVNSNDIFNIDTYEKVLNEYGIQINENIKQALIYNLDKALPDPKLTGRL